MQETLRKPESLITRHLRHFVFSRFFVSSKGESKTPVKSEAELFCEINQWLKAVSSGPWDIHPR